MKRTIINLVGFAVILYGGILLAFDRYEFANRHHTFVYDKDWLVLYDTFKETTCITHLGSLPQMGNITLQARDKKFDTGEYRADRVDADKWATKIIEKVILEEKNKEIGYVLIPSERQDNWSYAKKEWWCGSFYDLNEGEYSDRVELSSRLREAIKEQSKYVDGYRKYLDGHGKEQDGVKLEPKK